MNYAVVFDMDGVIFDSELAMLTCWREVADRFQLQDLEIPYYACIGTTYKRTREIMMDFYGPDFQYELISQEASRLFHDRYDGGRMPLKEGAADILSSLKKKGYSIALASSTRKASVERLLTDAGLRDYFDVCICGDMVEHSKPDPEIFLRACSELGIDSENAFGIEDSYNGIRALKAAGIHGIMVPDLKQPDDEIRSLAEVVVENLYQALEYIVEHS